MAKQAETLDAYSNNKLTNKSIPFLFLFGISPHSTHSRHIDFITK